MVFISDQIRLTPFEETDLPAVLRWVNDPFIREMIGTVRPITMAQHRRWYEGAVQDASRLFLTIRQPESDVPLGLVGLTGIDMVYRNAELWIYLGEGEARRKHLGKGAVLGVLELAFDTLGLHRVYVHVFDYNNAALRFFQACGFKPEGTLRQAAFKRGAFCDKHVLGILEDEFTRPEKS